MKKKRMNRMDIKAYLNEKKELVDNALKRYFLDSGDNALKTLKESMRYSLFAGGKRLRPILCIAAAEALGGNQQDVLPVACALEFIHTYSLIHDDLPVMDDDDLRRGRPTNHKIFGDAIALLAGDGLLTDAFYVMSNDKNTDPVRLLKVINLIARAAGSNGMVGGQVADIQSEGKDVDINMLEFIHTHKTGALITASVTSGAILAGGTEEEIEAISGYGKSIGLAFQIADDILNVIGDPRLLGKSVGSDKEKHKITYPGIVGLERSKEIQRNLVEHAISFLDQFDSRANPLRGIAKYIIERKK